MLKKSLCFIFVFVFVLSGTILFSACKKNKPEPEIYSATIEGLQFKALRTNWRGEFLDDCYHITLDFSVLNTNSNTQYLNEQMFVIETKKPLNIENVQIVNTEGSALSPEDITLESGELLNFNITFYFEPTDTIESLVNENTFICKYNNVIFARMKMEGSVIR